MFNFSSLLQLIASQYILDPLDLHGLNHWGRVLENGLLLAGSEGGDTVVISLFAIFHDACRQNQFHDPGHGGRGAALAKQILINHPDISNSQLALLVKACQEHTDGKTNADLTVQICWDADRLDLARATIMPDPKYLCTETAKTNEILSWANQRALANYSPPYVEEEWLPLFASK